MKLLLVLTVLLISHDTSSQETKLYRCQQSDGSVVVQDRRCIVTQLQQPKTVVRKKTIPSQARSRAMIKKQGSMVKHNSGPRKPTFRKPSSRSQYFQLGWEKLIPANWQLQKIKTSQYEQLLLSRSRFNGLNDFKEGVKLMVYADTMKLFRLGAFEQALKHYHIIRDNKNYRLLDSQFKSHQAFKVFNIKYMHDKNTLALTEFYIDEKHNDLFMVTVLSAESAWLSNWKFAEQLINRL